MKHVEQAKKFRLLFAPDRFNLQMYAATPPSWGKGKMLNHERFKPRLSFGMYYSVGLTAEFGIAYFTTVTWAEVRRCWQVTAFRLWLIKVLTIGAARQAAKDV